MAASIEVCFVSYLSGDDLIAAIESVHRHLPHAAIAVQEHADDDSCLVAAGARAAALGMTFRGRHEPSNPGFGAGCNALANTSVHDWLLFLNPDAQITAWPWGTEAPTPRTIFGPERFDGAHAESHRGLDYTVRDEAARSWVRRPGGEPDGHGFVSGAALLVARADHAAIGGFDEQFFLFYEDIDFCLRANAAGIATRLAKGWTVHHLGAHSTSPRFGAALQWSYESGVHFHGKRGESLAAYRTYVLVDSGARFVLQVVRRDPLRRTAYAALFRRAARDLVGRPAR